MAGQASSSSPLPGECQLALARYRFTYTDECVYAIIIFFLHLVVTSLYETLDNGLYKVSLRFSFGRENRGSAILRKFLLCFPINGRCRNFKNLIILLHSVLKIIRVFWISKNVLRNSRCVETSTEAVHLLFSFALKKKLIC